MQKSNMNEPPEGIIVTISKSMYGIHGYRHWLSNFLSAMSRHEEGVTYWLRQGNVPKHDSSLLYVYLCIGSKIRYRGYYAGSRGAASMQFENRSDILDGKAWVLISGPIERAPFKIEKSGFQGFRYTSKLF